MEQSPTDDSWRQLSTALLRSTLVAGEKDIRLGAEVLGLEAAFVVTASDMVVPVPAFAEADVDVMVIVEVEVLVEVEVKVVVEVEVEVLVEAEVEVLVEVEVEVLVEAEVEVMAEVAVEVLVEVEVDALVVSSPSVRGTLEQQRPLPSPPSRSVNPVLPHEALP